MTDGSIASRKWTELPYHRAWLLDQASALFEFFERHSIDPTGGFHQLDHTGQPILRDASCGGRPAREIHATCRMVHCFAIGRLMGRPGADRFVDHGMEFIWNAHRDRVNGGYFWGIGDAGPSDPLKQAYGHAFVLLAASSAKVVDHPDADRLLADVSDVLLTRFWEADKGAFAEEFAADWSSVSTYRGQNSNMHMTEALMAAYEATGDKSYLDMAESAATMVIRRRAAEQEWRVAEHFDEAWELDRDYANGDVFRPFGTTPGHSLEWARLLLQLWEMTGRRSDWLPEAAKALFAQAVGDSWDGENGGFFYTLDWSGKPHLRNRLWWPCAEGIGAASFLNAIDGAEEYEIWYRRIWDFVASELIDRENGGWLTQPVESQGAPVLFEGKPDIYHALQACLIPLLPTSGTITHGLLNEGLS